MHIRAEEFLCLGIKTYEVLSLKKWVNQFMQKPLSSSCSEKVTVHNAGCASQCLEQNTYNEIHFSYQEEN